MDFEELYRKYKSDTASQEEIQYIEDTVNNARKLAKIRLKGEKSNGALSKVGRFFKGLFISIIVLALLVGACVFLAWKSARDNIAVGKQLAETQAIEYVANDAYTSTSNVVETEKSKERLIITIPFDRSYFLYEFFYDVNGTSYDILVDTYTGMIETYN